MSEVLDPTAIDQLVHAAGGGSTAVLREVANMFLDLGPDKAAEIRAGFEAGDATTVAEAAHFLKGSAGTLGVTQVRLACQRVEEVAAWNFDGELERAIDELDQALALAVRALQDTISHLADS